MTNGNFFDIIECTNNLKGNGSRERTGAGLLDITALLNYSYSQINYEIAFSSTDNVELKDIYLSAGQTVRISLSWQRNATMTINKVLWIETSRTYTSDTLADFDLYLYDNNDEIVAYSCATKTNVEILTFTANTSGYYTMVLNPYSDYADTHNINYAYVIQ